MYKIKLTEIQINNICRLTDLPEKQRKYMSITAYLMKYTDAETMQLTKSLNKLYKMYSVNNWKNHKKIARSYFYEIANDVIANSYFLFKNDMDEKVYTLMDKINATQTIENTNVKDDLEKTNHPIDIYTYTKCTTKVIKVDALDLVQDVFNDLKIKSKIIKQMVINKLQGIKLDVHGAIAYIVKVIEEKSIQYNTMRVNYAKKVAKTRYSKDKNTFVAPVKTTNNALKFNNFEPRQYDYDLLEKQLLGWE